MNNSHNLTRLQETINYNFKNPEILKKALTHSSYANENNIESNELLEFLGDSVISFVVTEYLYNSFFEHSEGVLSRIKGKLCSRKNLNEKARNINLREFLFIESGEISGRKNENFLGNSYEALIGAIYLDSGFENTKKIIIENFSGDFKSIDTNNLHDPKSLLQELMQKKFQKIPEYKLIKETGQAHDKTFYIEVLTPFGNFKGCGKSKKEAETYAAKSALENVN